MLTLNSECRGSAQRVGQDVCLRMPFQVGAGRPTGADQEGSLKMTSRPGFESKELGAAPGHFIMQVQGCMWGERSRQGSSRDENCGPAPA